MSCWCWEWWSLSLISSIFHILDTTRIPENQNWRPFYQTLLLALWFQISLSALIVIVKWVLLFHLIFYWTYQILSHRCTNYARDLHLPVALNCFAFWLELMLNTSWVYVDHTSCLLGCITTVWCAYHVGARKKCLRTKCHGDKMWVDRM